MACGWYLLFNLYCKCGPHLFGFNTDLDEVIAFLSIFQNEEFADFYSINLTIQKSIEPYKVVISPNLMIKQYLDILKFGPARRKRGNLGPCPRPWRGVCPDPPTHSYLPDLGRYRTRTTKAME